MVALSTRVSYTTRLSGSTFHSGELYNTTEWWYFHSCELNNITEWWYFHSRELYNTTELTHELSDVWKLIIADGSVEFCEATPIGLVDDEPKVSLYGRETDQDLRSACRCVACFLFIFSEQAVCV